jgi:hypothetical protein
LPILFDDVTSIGPWAMMVALYGASLEDNYKGYISKQQLITLATPLCNSSFNNEEAGYTAWSSMKTLISKLPIVALTNDLS